MNSFLPETSAGNLISLDRARSLVRSFPFLNSVNMELRQAVNSNVAHDIHALSHCPSIDVSLKDGYAVFSTDITRASDTNPVRLRIVDTITAGQKEIITRLQPGQAIRIMTGSPLPEGAEAVLASEFATKKGNTVIARRDAEPGRNILRKAADVRSGSLIIGKGMRLTPATIGLLAAAGLKEVPVIRQPKIMIVAIGNELVPPGNPIGPGQVAASNMATLEAELLSRGMRADTLIIRDDLEHLEQQLSPLFNQYDIFLTCGGVLDGDKDFTMQAMDVMGVKNVFKRVRVGPGKGTCLGYRNDTLVFNLPGGPPSNHIGFLLLALPGILRRGGVSNPFDNSLRATLSQALEGQPGWTRILYGKLEEENGHLLARPLTDRGRLQAMAEADCLIEIPEQKSPPGTETVTKIWKTTYDCKSSPAPHLRPIRPPHIASYRFVGLLERI